MRFRKAIINTVAGVIGNLLAGMLQFISRIIFVRYLDDEYLGISSLFTNILSFLSLAELGIGTAIGFNLYKPLSDSNTQRIKSIMFLLKKAYNMIGFIIMGVGGGLLPFLPMLIKGNTDLVNINILYIMYLLQSASSYWFWGYKSILLQADQKLYLVKFYQVLCYLIVTTIQLITLAIYRNFMLYSIIGLTSNIITNILISITVDKKYPYINEKDCCLIKREEIQNILKNVFGMSLFKINTTIVNSADNIMISAFIHVRIVALYGNYQIIISGISQVIMQLFSGITASIGNLYVEESIEKSEFMFRCVQLLCYWVYSVVGIGILIFINPVIEFFFGEERLFTNDLVFLQVLYFIINGFQRTCFIYRDACGLFWKGKLRPIATSIINIFISIVLVYQMGLEGIVIGTILSWLLTTWWYDPILIYKLVFKKSPLKYFINYTKAVIVTLCTGAITLYISKVLPLDGSLKYAVQIILILLIPNLGYFVIYNKTMEFCYLKDALKTALIKIH